MYCTCIEAWWASLHPCWFVDFQISCYKDGQLLQTETDRLIPGGGGETTTLHYRLALDRLQESDYGNYTCEAVNAVGLTRDSYQLRGQPDQPRVVSGAQSTGNTFYVLAWQVWTPATLPILNQSILYRLRKKVLPYQSSGSCIVTMLTGVENFHCIQFLPRHKGHKQIHSKDPKRTLIALEPF
jgi:hypothetical protein